MSEKENKRKENEDGENEWAQTPIRIEQIEEEIETGQASKNREKPKKLRRKQEDRQEISKEAGESKVKVKKREKVEGASDITPHPLSTKEIEEVKQPYVRHAQEKLISILRDGLQGDKIDPSQMEELTQPFWKIPPENETQRTIWKERWANTLLMIARRRETFHLDLKSLLANPPTPLEGMHLKNLRLAVNYLVEENLARWLNEEQTTAVFYWRTLKEIAECIYEHALDIGVPILSLEHIRRVYKLPRKDLHQILELIARKDDVKVTLNTLFFQL